MGYKTILNNNKIILNNGKMYLNKFASVTSIQKVSIVFSSPPSNIGITKAPLKYNKRFAFSYVWDDGLLDAYTYGFKYLNGGTAGDGTVSSGKTYTDGCGNKVKFNVGLAIYTTNNTHTVDYHSQPDAGSVYILWNQLKEVYNAGWAINNHAFDASITNYDVERNRSYIYRQTSGATTKVFTQPQGDTQYIPLVWAITGSTKYYEYMNQQNWQTYFGSGNGVDIPAGRVDQDLLSGERRIGYDKWPVNQFGMIRTSATSSATVIDSINSLIKATGTTYHTWNSNLCHSVSGAGGGFGSFSDFKTAMDYIEDNYGSDGNDTCWMACDQDVYEYLTTRDTTVITQELNGNTLDLTFSYLNTNTGNTLPDDMRNYSLSLIISGNTSISDIIIEGGEGCSLNKSYGTNTALINLNWIGGLSMSSRLLRIATEKVEKAESTISTGDKEIAQDYVTSMVNGTDKTNLQNRLNSI